VIDGVTLPTPAQVNETQQPDRDVANAVECHDQLEPPVSASHLQCCTGLEVRREYLDWVLPGVLRLWNWVAALRVDDELLAGFIAQSKLCS
jgi:hypothetical protein